MGEETTWFAAQPSKFEVDENGRHVCSNCGHMWWLTHILIGEDDLIGWSLEAICGKCQFPLMPTKEETP